MNEAEERNRVSPAGSAGGEALEEKLEAYLAEYQSLRAEMEWLIRGADQYQNLTFALIGAAATIFPWVLDKAPILLVPTLLILPLLFSLLGFLFLRQHEEVYVVAAYLSEYIRPRIRLLVGDSEAWGWEEFKDQRSREVLGRGPLAFFSKSKIIVFLRSSLFVLPSVAALVIVVNGLDFEHLFQSMAQHLVLNILMGIWFLFDAVFVLLFVFHLWSQGDLPNRILRLETTLKMADITRISAGQSSKKLPSSEPPIAEQTSVNPT